MCQTCEHYRHGSGDRYCINQCPKFRWVLPRRYTPRGEPVPQIILEAIPADTNTHEELSKALQQLEARAAIIIFQRFWLNYSHEEIAEYHQISRPNVTRSIKNSLIVLNDILKS